MDPGRDRGRPDVGQATSVTGTQERPIPAPGPALSIVIPVYNEGENIRPTLEAIREHVQVRPIEILVVHDFPEDSTVPVVRQLQAEMPDVRLHLNQVGRGVLNALRSGLAAARAPYVLVTMADRSDDAADIDRMYRLAAAGADVVAGSRYVAGGRQRGGPVLKRTLSRLAGLSLHLVAGVATHDPTNNFKIYSKRLLEMVEIESDAGFELALELTVKAHRLGLTIAEVPTTWTDRTAGESRFQLRRWLPRYLQWYWWGMTTRPRRLLGM